MQLQLSRPSKQPPPTTPLLEPTKQNKENKTSKQTPNPPDPASNQAPRLLLGFRAFSKVDLIRGTDPFDSSLLQLAPTKPPATASKTPSSKSTNRLAANNRPTSCPPYFLAPTASPTSSAQAQPRSTPKHRFSSLAAPLNLLSHRPKPISASFRLLAYTAGSIRFDRKFWSCTNCRGTH
ncbi:hypothetical protein M758_UG009200, partial [Ceratodon purpureus]